MTSPAPANGPCCSSEVGLVGHLFESCLDLFTEFLKAARRSEALSAVQDRQLYKQLEGLLVWGDGFKPAQGELDRILSHSASLRILVLQLLSAVGDTLLQRLSSVIEYPLDDKEFLEKRTVMIGLLENASDIIPANEVYDRRDNDSDVEDPNAELDNIIGSLATYIGCLLDTVPSLEVAKHFIDRKENATTENSPHMQNQWKLGQPSVISRQAAPTLPRMQNAWGSQSLPPPPPPPPPPIQLLPPSPSPALPPIADLGPNWGACPSISRTPSYTQTTLTGEVEKKSKLFPIAKTALGGTPSRSTFFMMTQDELYKDTFQRALTSFKMRLTPKQEEDFQFVTLKDVLEVIAHIQSKQENLKMMNISRIQVFLQAMEQFGKVIDVFLNASNFVAFVWGPMKFLLQVASTSANSFDILLGAYEQIGGEIPLLEQYMAIFDHGSHIRMVLGLIYSDILEFHKNAIRLFSCRVWRQVFRSLWKDFGTRFKHILDSLHRHRELIQGQAAALHFQQYQQDNQVTLASLNILQYQLLQYQQDRLQILDQLNRLGEAEIEKKYNEVMEWILGAKAKLDHEFFCNTRREYPGSGDWILKHEKVQNWKEADTPVSSILWINGIPGAGKTILASVIIDDCMHDQSFTTSYFYCRDRDPEKNNCTSVFKGLLSQLLSQNLHLVPYCHDKYLSSGELTLTSTCLANQLLELFCHETPKQYIIIDGLDECDLAERKLIMHFFTTMVGCCNAYLPGKLRVLFVSQDYNDIRKALPTAAIISLGPMDNKNDIRAYVEWWAMEIQRKFEVEGHLIDYIKTSTCARARGMFLFAKLIMPNLHQQPTRQHLLNEIEASRIPKGLEECYERIISRIKRSANSEEWKIIQKLLGWIACARRPLKWHEIQGAISIDPVGQTIDFENRKLRINIRDLCGSLVQVLPGDRVELVHSTAKMYITSNGHVCEATAECNLAALCLQYLTFECFEKDIEQDRLRQFALDGYFAFQDYAIAKWSHHFHAMVDAGQDLFSGDSDNQTALQEIDVALDDFTNNYEEDILREPVVSTSEEACKAFKDCTFYDNLLSVWSHIYRHQNKGFEARNDVSIGVLGEVLVRNRQLIEDLPSLITYSSSGRAQDLDSFYGEKRYKCSKLTCFFFHEGFKDAKSRVTHINHHDRPFNCTFPDCSVVEFGFSSNRDLEKHMRVFHPEISDLANQFAPKAAVPAKTPHECPMCKKKFTCLAHQKTHVLSHEGSRPFACPECGKTFTRSNDCRRHQKLHGRR